MVALMLAAMALDPVRVPLVGSANSSTTWLPRRLSYVWLSWAWLDTGFRAPGVDGATVWPGDKSVVGDACWRKTGKSEGAGGPKRVLSSWLSGDRTLEDLPREWRAFPDIAGRTGWETVGVWSGVTPRVGVDEDLAEWKEPEGVNVGELYVRGESWC